MSGLASFDFAARTRVVFGAGGLDRLGALVAGLGVHRVLLVSDQGIAAARHVERAAASLRRAGLVVGETLDVDENPDTRTVDRVLDVARATRPDLFVGLGGGSPIDAAKGANFLLTNGGAMEDYRGHDRATKPLLPLVAVPTTAGTGTEVQSFALVERASDHQKMACGDPSAAPVLALLDPELTVTQPRQVTAHTGLDAIGHAVESFVTTRRNPLSCLYAREAYRRADAAFPRVLEAPDDLEARGSMLLAATWAGLAIEHSMLGAAHALANPLTAHHRVVHGAAVGTVLPAVVRFNAVEPEIRGYYADLARAAGLAPDAEALASRLEEHLARAGLGAHGVGLDDVAPLAVEAARQWTAGFNPRPVTEDDLAALYREALARVGVD